MLVIEAQDLIKVMNEERTRTCLQLEHIRVICDTDICLENIASSLRCIQGALLNSAAPY